MTNSVQCLRERERHQSCHTFLSSQCHCKLAFGQAKSHRIKVISLLKEHKIGWLCLGQTDCIGGFHCRANINFFFSYCQVYSILHFFPNNKCSLRGWAAPLNLNKRVVVQRRIWQMVLENPNLPWVFFSTLGKALPFLMAVFAAYPIKHSSQMSFWGIGQLSFQWHWLHSTVRGWESGGWRSEKAVWGIWRRRFALQRLHVGDSPSEKQFLLWSGAELNLLCSLQV